MFTIDLFPTGVDERVRIVALDEGRIDPTRSDHLWRWMAYDVAGFVTHDPAAGPERLAAAILTAIADERNL